MERKQAAKLLESIVGFFQLSPLKLQGKDEWDSFVLKEPGVKSRLCSQFDTLADSVPGPRPPYLSITLPHSKVTPHEFWNILLFA